MAWTKVKIVMVIGVAVVLARAPPLWQLKDQHRMN